MTAAERVKICVCVLFAALFMLAHSRAGELHAGGFTLVKGGAPAAAFVITPEQAQEISGCAAARGMAEDFNEDLYECAGCSLPVLEADDGVTPAIRFRIEERNVRDLDRFGITFPDERTMLITASTAGLRWALNHILTEFAGVRYLAPSRNGAHFPRLDFLAVPREEISVSPSFSISRRVTHEPYWDSRMGNLLRVAKRVPRGHNLYRHAFPVERYIREGSFPEYIFPVVGGERYLPYEDPSVQDAWKEYTGRWSDYSGRGWQPCLTDERAVEEAVGNIIEYFDRNPGVSGISMTQNDNAVFCRCEGCEKAFRGERNHLGYMDYSDMYYGWINRIAGMVAEKHPDKYFGVVTYRETASPPGFELHESIIPFLLFDTQQAMDEEVRQRREEFFRSWAAKSSLLGARSYPWGWHYDMPRVYFSLQKEMIQLTHSLGARAAYAAYSGGMQEGPKAYLYHKLLWDADLDLEETLGDWYEACVGAEAAPYLAEYYRKWERIWEEEAVKTEWFKSGKDRVYLNYFTNKSYLFAVSGQDLHELDGLMGKISELAGKHGDERQKIRAGWLMRDFEYSRACIKAIGGHILPASGVVEEPSQAIAFLEFLPEALRYDDLRYKLHGMRTSDPDLGSLFPDRDLQPPYVPEVLGRIAAAASDPGVLDALEAASEDASIPRHVRSLLDVFIRVERGEPVDNLVLDGKFEYDNKDWRQGSVRPDQSYSGENSLRLWLAPPHRSIISKHGRDFERRESGPGWYYVSLMVFVDEEHPDEESHVQFRASAYRDGRAYAHFDSSRVNVPPREWTRISLLAAAPRADSFQLDRIHFRNYSRGTLGYIDDVVVVPLGE